MVMNSWNLGGVVKYNNAPEVKFKHDIEFINVAK